MKFYRSHDKVIQVLYYGEMTEEVTKKEGSRVWTTFSRSYLRFEHHIAACFFVGGFIFDIFLFSQIDYALKHALIIFYISIAGASILLYQFHANKQQEILSTLQVALPFIIQFAFGGIMSGMFVYYFKSASIIQSWVFLFAIILMLIGNEFLRKRYHRLEFQVSVFFISVYAFMIVLLPYLRAEIGSWIFLQSCAVSIGIIALFLFLLQMINKKALRESVRVITISILTIVMLLNGLFFARIIPPIPLALSDAGVFHTLERNTDGNYSGTKEPTPRYARLIPFRTTFHGSGPIFFFSAVFAPTTLNTPITHEWQYRDETNGKWVTSTKIHFPIIGGREKGYRAYSTKDTITPGKWRVNVLTKNGQSLGSYTFTVVPGESPTALFPVSL